MSVVLLRYFCAVFSCYFVQFHFLFIFFVFNFSSFCFVFLCFCVFLSFIYIYIYSSMYIFASSFIQSCCTYSNFIFILVRSIPLTAFFCFAQFHFIEVRVQSAFYFIKNICHLLFSSPTSWLLLFLLVFTMVLRARISKIWYIFLSGRILTRFSSASVGSVKNSRGIRGYSPR